MSSHTFLASTQESKNVSGDALNTLNDSNELKNWGQNNNKWKLKCMSINCPGVKTKTAEIATVIDKHKLEFIRGNETLRVMKSSQKTIRSLGKIGLMIEIEAVNSRQ